VVEDDEDPTSLRYGLAGVELGCVLLVAVPGRSLPPHAASNTAKEQARLAFTNPLKSVFMY
jgi:hypothetical protein